MVSCVLCGDTREVTELEKLKEMCRDDNRFLETRQLIKKALEDDDLTFAQAPVRCSFPADLLSRLPSPESEDFTSEMVQSVAFFLGFVEHFEDLPEGDVFRGGQGVEVTLLRSQTKIMSTLALHFEVPYEDLIVLSAWLRLRYQKRDSKRS